MNFSSHTDRVVAQAVHLVNAFTGGEARGRPFAPPENRLDELRLLDPRITDRDAGKFAALAAELRVVFEAAAAGDLDTAARQVNRLLGEMNARPYLDRHDGEPWHLHFHGADGTPARDWGASCATGLAIVIGGEFRDRLGVCTAPHCDRVYVDASRNGTRRFCCTACQNRVKTAAFRARTR